MFMPMPLYTHLTFIPILLARYHPYSPSVPRFILHFSLFSALISPGYALVTTHVHVLASLSSPCRFKDTRDAERYLDAWAGVIMCVCAVLGCLSGMCFMQCLPSSFVNLYFLVCIA